MNILLKECIEALAEDIQVLDDSGSELVYRRFQDEFEFVGIKMPWDSIEGVIAVERMEDLPEIIQRSQCYILWSGAGIPVLRTNMRLVISNFDDVSAVDFDKYFTAIDYTWMVGVYSNDTIGYCLR